MITKLNYHDQCSVAVEWLDPNTNMHHAKLLCTDDRCKRKSRFVQWLNLDDAFELTEQLNIPQLNKQIPVKQWSIKELEI